MWGPPVGGWPVLGALRWAREWARSRLGERGESNLPVDAFSASDPSLGPVFVGADGCTARSGVSLGWGGWPLGVAGGVQRSVWSFEAPPFTIHGASQQAPTGREPNSDSSQ